MAAAQYQMRGWADDDDAAIYWLATGAPDYTGASAPEAVHDIVLLHAIAGSGGLDEYADYASLPGGASDGDSAATTDTGEVWIYNDATSLWLPPHVQPSAVVFAYDCTLTPTAATPAWSSTGGESATVSGGVLTIADTDAGDYRYFDLQHADIDSAKSVGVLFRAKMTAQSAGGDGNKCFVGLRPGSLGACVATIAFGTALSAANNICLMGDNGNSLYTGNATPDTALADNAVWTTYLLVYRKDADTYELRALGETTGVLAAPEHAAVTYSMLATSVRFGCKSVGNTVTVEFDYISLFQF